MRIRGWVPLATVVIVAATIVVTAPAGAAVPPKGPPQAALGAELKQATGGAARLAYNSQSGLATFAGGTAIAPLSGARTGTPAQVARAFVDHYAPMFGVADPHANLTELQTVTSSSGSAVRYQQRYHGIPVIAGEVAVQLATDGSVLSSTGEALPVADIDATATVPAADAAATARAVAVKEDGAEPASLTESPELWIYDPALLGADDPGAARLVWRVEVRTALGDIDRLVLVDAHDGNVALQFSQREDGLNRSVCDNLNSRALSQTCSAPVRTEGGPVTGQPDADLAYDLSGVTYNFYLNRFGRDSIDGAGMALKSTVRYCMPALSTACPFANAFWNGQQMVYGTGYATADDVVGHELTHGVTDRTSGLFYYADAGAINESISDVMGELIDLSDTTSGADAPGSRWLLGEQLPIGAIRNMADPAAFNDPDSVTSVHWWADRTDHRGVHENSGVNNKAASLITDGGVFNGQTITGLGPNKTAQIYYVADTTLLTPGSDYRDLFNILPQACLNSVGIAGIVAADCNEVTKAVTATEMNQFPQVPGSHLTAPQCDAGQGVSSTLFVDDMGTRLGGWQSAGDGAWDYTTVAYHSPLQSLGNPSLGSIGQSALVSKWFDIPDGTTYLEFAHSYELDSDDSGHFYDGGVVEYRTDTQPWLDAVNLPGTINGYDGVLSAAYGNPLGGRSAYSGASPGWVTTRIDLSSLARHSVQVRFLLGTDSSVRYTGWFIDDVSVYGCSSITPLTPARLWESRPGLSTVDGQYNGFGKLGAGSDIHLKVAGRGGVDQFAAAVALNVTATGAQAPGFVTVYPCGSPRPTASNLNVTVGATVANAVVARIGTDGFVCFFSQSPVDLIVDVTGYFPPGSSLAPLVPARLMETRAGLTTVDNLDNGILMRQAGQDTAVRVVGRGGVSATASAVVLNITATEAQSPGFITVHPCGSPVPNASNLNVAVGATVANAVIARVGMEGSVCIFNQSPTHLVVDVNGYFPAGTDMVSLVPARVLETRPGLSTVDGQFNSIGQRPAGTVTELPVRNRGGVSSTASTAVLNVTATNAQAPGFITVYPCDSSRPNASNLNVATGDTVANAVVVKVGSAGSVCIFNQSATDLVVDVNGYFP